MKRIKLIAIILIFFSMAYSQNVGINVPSPSEKLEVGGIIYTNQGGVKFPDQTIQTTAAMSSTQNPNSFVRKQPFLTFPLTSGFTDTFEIIKIIDGGAKNQFNGSSSAGFQASKIPFTLIVNLEKSIHKLFQSVVQGISFEKATIHFTQNATPVVYKTIELRQVVVTDFISSTDYLGQNNYGHLVELTFFFDMLEIRNFSPSSCFCWNFKDNQNCTCD